MSSQSKAKKIVEVGDYDYGELYEALLEPVSDEDVDLALELKRIVSTETFVEYIQSSDARPDVIRLIVLQCLENLIYIDYRGILHAIAAVLCERQDINEEDWMEIFRLLVDRGASCPGARVTEFSFAVSIGGHILALFGKKPDEMAVNLVSFFCDGLLYSEERIGQIVFITACQELGITWEELCEKLPAYGSYYVVEAAIRNNQIGTLRLLLFSNMCFRKDGEKENVLELSDKLGNEDALALIESTYRGVDTSMLFDEVSILSLGSEASYNDETPKLIDSITMVMGDTIGYQLLMYAIDKRDEALVENAFRLGFNVDAMDQKGKTILFTVLMSEDEWAVRKFIREHVELFDNKGLPRVTTTNVFKNIEERNLCGFIVALQNLPDRKRVLLDLMDDSGMTVLDRAIETGDVVFAEVALEAGANQNTPGHPALNKAVASGVMDMVDLFLRSKPVLDQVDSDKNTALHIAVLNQDIRAAMMLLFSLGKDSKVLTMTNNNLMTVGAIAATKSKKFFEEFLAGAGPRIIIPCNGRSPMFTFIEKGDLNMVSMMTNMMLRGNPPVASMSAFAEYGFLNYAIGQRQQQIVDHFRKISVPNAEQDPTILITEEFIRTMEIADEREILGVAERVIEQNSDDNKALLILLIDKFGFPLGKNNRGLSLRDIAVNAGKQELVDLCDLYNPEPTYIPVHVKGSTVSSAPVHRMPKLHGFAATPSSLLTQKPQVSTTLPTKETPKSHPTHDDEGDDETYEQLPREEPRQPYGEMPIEPSAVINREQIRQNTGAAAAYGGPLAPPKQSQHSVPVRTHRRSISDRIRDIERKIQENPQK